MNFKKSIQLGFRNYSNFKGRAQRSEYWFWILFYFLFVLIGLTLKSVVFARGMNFSNIAPGVFLPFNLIQLGLILPTISVFVRRLHDLDRKGWWWLIMLIPFGSLVVFIWLCSKGTAGANRFGEEKWKAE